MVCRFFYSSEGPVQKWVSANTGLNFFQPAIGFQLLQLKIDLWQTFLVYVVRFPWSQCTLSKALKRANVLLENNNNNNIAIIIIIIIIIILDKGVKFKVSPNPWLNLTHLRTTGLCYFSCYCIPSFSIGPSAPPPPPSSSIPTSPFNSSLPPPLASGRTIWPAEEECNYH